MGKSGFWYIIILYVISESLPARPSHIILCHHQKVNQLSHAHRAGTLGTKPNVAPLEQKLNILKIHDWIYEKP